MGGDEAGREDEKVVTLEDLGLELARGGRIQGGAPDEGIVLPGIGPEGLRMF